MLWFIAWLIAVELMALGALPMAVRLFRSLPDRGYLFAKPLGMLVVAYLCWLLGVLGILRFQQTTIAMTLVVVGVLSWARWGRQTLEELTSVRAAILTTETLFLLFFLAATLVRAYNPEISGTEKPMDLALMNSLYRGDALPPEDPWMSGFSISYYYFGYLLVAMVAKLSGVPAAVGYNLGVGLVFALLLAGSFSLSFSIISSLGPAWRFSRRVLGALLAPVLVGIMGNLEIGLELMANRGVGDAAFWNWAGVKGLQAAAQPEGWFPTSHWWWWRASRIVPNTKPDGINEFPFFSFLLGDLHPHFTVLPWALLVVALSAAVILKTRGEKEGATDDWLWTVVPAMALGVLLVGNSWDFPTYTALFWAASLAAMRLSSYPDPLPLGEGNLPRPKGEGGGEGRFRSLVPTLKRLAMVSACSVLLYSPFFLGFASQTRGIGLSPDRTPLASMLIIFGPFLFILACFLTWRAWPGSASTESGKGRRMSRLLPVVGWALIVGSWFLGSMLLLLGFLALAGAAARRTLTGGDTVLSERTASRRGTAPARGEEAARSAAERFLLILVAGGTLLILVPELVFLVDLFGTRMNTVFKFDYQAWVLLGLASSVAAAWITAEAGPRATRWLFLVGAALIVGVGLLYPLAATPAKARFQGQPTLDGAAFYQDIRPDDYAALRWLADSTTGQPVVLEATGAEYSEYARVSTFSGLPTVLGWAGHEVQWRGRGEEPQQRTQDIEAIYKTADRTTMRALLEKYQVDYVFVGSLEVEKYGAGVADRFEGMLQMVQRQGKVIVYRVPW